MEQCKCPNCGAAINTARMICEYCGTAFKDGWTGPAYKPEFKIVVQQPGVKVLGAVMQISEFDMMHMKEQGDLDRYIRGRLAHVMAEKLMEHMDIEYSHNVHLRSVECMARLRVLDPDFKF